MSGRFLVVVKGTDVFETNRTRAVKAMQWIAVPNKHDSDGFLQVMDHDNGVAHYGAWMLLLQVASKCTPRWVLARTKAHDDVTTTSLPVEWYATPYSQVTCTHAKGFGECIHRSDPKAD